MSSLARPPLALYIHWPFCAKKCPYCDYNSYAVGWDAAEAKTWADAYTTEIRTLAARYPDYRLDTLFFGGGTPSQMPLSVLSDILQAIHKHWPHHAPQIEITFEANPRDIAPNALTSWKQLGINRLSLGVQSFDDAELSFLGRDHDVKTALMAIHDTADVFDRYSFDLMYGLPAHTVDVWGRNLDQALALDPSHLSLYQLTIEPDTGFYRPFQRGDYCLPENNVLADLFTLTHDRCAGAGLIGYEISSFAKTGQECRHNLHYWHYNDYIGIGPGSHGRITHNSAKYTLSMTKNPILWRNLVQKQGHGLSENDPLTPYQSVIERLYMGLRLRDGLPALVFKTLLDSGFLDVASYQRLRRDNLLCATKQSVYLTPTGRLRLDAVVEQLINSP